MVTTPTVWKAQHKVKNTDDFHSDYPPIFADIGLGGYASVWNRVAFDDVRARLSEAEGNLIGDEFRANHTTDDQQELVSSVASRPGGGFLALYDSVEGGSPDMHSFFVDIFDEDGTYVGNEIIFQDDPNVGDSPALAAANDGSYLVTYARKRPDSSWDVVAKFVDADSEPDPEVTIFDSGDTQETSSVVARLSNDSYVVVYQNFFGPGDYDLDFRLVDATGTPGSGGQVVASFDDEAEMKVAALTGGGFVVVWTDRDEANDDSNHGGIRYSVYPNSGGPIKAPPSIVDGGFAVNTTSAGNQIKPDVVGLKDGGFVVVWLDAQRHAVYGQRFDAAGNKVGGEFLAGSGTLGSADPTSVALLSDGRFVVGFNYSEFFSTGAGQGYATIFDPREKTINGDGNNNVITSRIDGATVNGLGGADTLLGQGSADTLNGGGGIDTMKGRGGDDTYIVDELSDFPVENVNQGNDLVLSGVSYSLVANVENLTLTGTAVSGGGNGIANIVTGHDGLNRLDGFNGNDMLFGRGGSDFLLGGNNDDKLFGEAGSDDLEGNDGNDALDGGIGADTMRGGAQNDTYVVENAGDKAIESSGQGTDLVKASASFTLGSDVENLTLTGNGAIDGTGNGLANEITGSGGANRINGGIGLDTLTGGLGPDTFVFDASVSGKTVAKDNPNADTITDFNPTDDTIELLASVFPKLKVGFLKNKTFDSGKKKPSKDKHAVYYDEKNGDLWYDANGKKKGGKGDVLIATLDPGLDLTAADIVVA